ncbi:FkbM family methyltransferase [Geomonas paludis]|uniref:FkbM family methyltransferase n=1 Tax=Geomonas paludis TaxID=2740185 RepID=A0ABY4L859_9BACT|nr:FkbM family methyltransferase [Geomonas paludis]UPU34137.1 FkbM family methyltransferase [Geomonas paludis]
MDKKLIIDVGMHVGKDSEFYLKKGFNVVAIEANPVLVATAKTALAEYVTSGRLIIQNVAIAPYEGEIDFFVNAKHDDWGTISKEFAERNERLGSSSEVIKVKCTTFDKILQDFSVPYYLKIDVEGVDALCLEQLFASPERPQYISIEAGLTSFEETFNELSLLWRLGYRDFKIVNQAQNYAVRCPNPPVEGDYVDYRFDGLCSGPFGEESPGEWMGIEETFAKYKRLLLEQKYFGANGKFYNTIFHRVYERLKRAPAGWYDFHARLGRPSGTR